MVLEDSLRLKPLSAASLHPPLSQVLRQHTLARARSRLRSRCVAVQTPPARGRATVRSLELTPEADSNFKESLYRVYLGGSFESADFSEEHARAAPHHTSPPTFRRAPVVLDAVLLIQTAFRGWRSRAMWLPRARAADRRGRQAARLLAEPCTSCGSPAAEPIPVAPLRQAAEPVVRDAEAVLPNAARAAAVGWHIPAYSTKTFAATRTTASPQSLWGSVSLSIVSDSKTYNVSVLQALLLKAQGQRGPVASPVDQEAQSAGSGGSPCSERSPSPSERLLLPGQLGPVEPQPLAQLGSSELQPPVWEAERSDLISEPESLNSSEEEEAPPAAPAVPQPLEAAESPVASAESSEVADDEVLAELPPLPPYRPLPRQQPWSSRAAESASPLEEELEPGGEVLGSEGLSPLELEEKLQLSLDILGSVEEQISLANGLAARHALKVQQEEAATAFVLQEWELAEQALAAQESYFNTVAWHLEEQHAAQMRDLEGSLHLAREELQAERRAIEEQISARQALEQDRFLHEQANLERERMRLMAERMQLDLAERERLEQQWAYLRAQQEQQEAERRAQQEDKVAVSRSREHSFEEAAKRQAQLHAQEMQLLEVSQRALAERLSQMEQRHQAQTEELTRRLNKEEELRRRLETERVELAERILRQSQVVREAPVQERPKAEVPVVAAPAPRPAAPAQAPATPVRPASAASSRSATYSEDDFEDDFESEGDAAELEEDDGHSSIEEESLRQSSGRASSSPPTRQGAKVLESPRLLRDVPSQPRSPGISEEVEEGEDLAVAESISRPSWDEPPPRPQRRQAHSESGSVAEELRSDSGRSPHLQAPSEVEDEPPGPPSVESSAASSQSEIEERPQQQEVLRPASPSSIQSESEAQPMQAAGRREAHVSAVSDEELPSPARSRSSVSEPEEVFSRSPSRSRSAEVAEELRSASRSDEIEEEAQVGSQRSASEIEEEAPVVEEDPEGSVHESLTRGSWDDDDPPQGAAEVASISSAEEEPPAPSTPSGSVAEELPMTRRTGGSSAAPSEISESRSREPQAEVVSRSQSAAEGSSPASAASSAQDRAKGEATRRQASASGVSVEDPASPSSKKSFAYSEDFESEAAGESLSRSAAPIPEEQAQEESSSGEEALRALHLETEGVQDLLKASSGSAKLQQAKLAKIQAQATAAEKLLAQKEELIEHRLLLAKLQMEGERARALALQALALSVEQEVQRRLELLQREMGDAAPQQTRPTARPLPPPLEDLLSPASGLEPVPEDHEDDDLTDLRKELEAKAKVRDQLLKEQKQRDKEQERQRMEKELHRMSFEIERLQHQLSPRQRLDPLSPRQRSEGRHATSSPSVPLTPQPGSDVLSCPPSRRGSWGVSLAVAAAAAAAATSPDFRHGRRLSRPGSISPPISRGSAPGSCRRGSVGRASAAVQEARLAATAFAAAQGSGEALSDVSGQSGDEHGGTTGSVVAPSISASQSALGMWVQPSLRSVSASLAEEVPTPRQNSTGPTSPEREAEPASEVPATQGATGITVQAAAEVVEELIDELVEESMEHLQQPSEEGRSADELAEPSQGTDAASATPAEDLTEEILSDLLSEMVDEMQERSRMDRQSSSDSAAG